MVIVALACGSASNEQHALLPPRAADGQVQRGGRLAGPALEIHDGDRARTVPPSPRSFRGFIFPVIHRTEVPRNFSPSAHRIGEASGRSRRGASAPRVLGPSARTRSVPRPAEGHPLRPPSERRGVGASRPRYARASVRPVPGASEHRSNGRSAQRRLGPWVHRSPRPMVPRCVGTSEHSRPGARGRRLMTPKGLRCLGAMVPTGVGPAAPRSIGSGRPRSIGASGRRSRSRSVRRLRGTRVPRSRRSTAPRRRGTSERPGLGATDHRLMTPKRPGCLGAMVLRGIGLGVPRSIGPSGPRSVGALERKPAGSRVPRDSGASVPLPGCSEVIGYFGASGPEGRGASARGVGGIEEPRANGAERRRPRRTEEHRPEPTPARRNIGRSAPGRPGTRVHWLRRSVAPRCWSTSERSSPGAKVRRFVASEGRTERPRGNGIGEPWCRAPGSNGASEQWYRAD